MPTRIPLLMAGLILTLSSLAAAQRNVSPAVTHQPRNTDFLILSGQVLSEDGRPYPEIVQIDLVCQGRIKQITPTAPDGTFTFEIGAPRSEDWLDPSLGGSSDGSFDTKVSVARGERVSLDQVPSPGRGRVNFSGCEVRVAPEPGLVSNSIPLTTRATSDNPDIGVIVIRRTTEKKGQIVSVSILGAPKDARKAFDKATSELEKENPNTGKIKQELAKAIEEYPKFSAAWDLLARVQMSEGNREEARSSFLRAVEAEPDFVQPHMGLAQMAVEVNDWDETARCTDKVLKIEAANPKALFWNGLANYYLNRFDEGEKALSSLYQLGFAQEYPFGLLPLGVIHANQGRIEEAATELRLYLKTMPQEQVPDAQRLELEKQLAFWESQGLTSPEGGVDPAPKMP